MPQLRVSIRSDTQTGDQTIHAVGPDGTILPVRIALAVVTAAYHELLIEVAKEEIARDKLVKPANGADLDRLPKIEGL